MYKMMLCLIPPFMLTSALMFICLYVSKKGMMNREKMSPFECGFDPKSSPRSPFSSQFFLIAVLFLIFDIEIVIILPMVTTMKTSYMSSWMITSTTLLFILLVGLYHEWKNGILEWSN